MSWLVIGVGISRSATTYYVSSALSSSSSAFRHSDRTRTDRFMAARGCHRTVLRILVFFGDDWGVPPFSRQQPIACQRADCRLARADWERRHDVSGV